jgi:hypothetical protein
MMLRQRMRIRAVAYRDAAAPARGTPRRSRMPPLRAWRTSLVAAPPSVTACLAPHALLGDGTPWRHGRVAGRAPGLRRRGSSNHAGAVTATEEPATTVRASGATAVTGPVGEEARSRSVRNPFCGPAERRAMLSLAYGAGISRSSRFPSRACRAVSSGATSRASSSGFVLGGGTSPVEVVFQVCCTTLHARSASLRAATTRSSNVPPYA